MERAPSPPSIVAADQLARALETTLAGMFGEVEREELLVELVPAMEARGYAAGALRAVKAVSSN